MESRKHKIRYGRLLPVVVLAIAMIFSSISVFAIEDGDTVTYRASHSGSGAGQVARFRIVDDSTYSGCCAEQGVDFSSGEQKGKVGKISNSTKAAKLMYKYAIEKDWWSGPDAEDVEVARSALRGHGSNVQYANITPRRLVEAIAQISNQGKSSWTRAITNAGGWPDWEAELVTNWYDSLSTDGITVPDGFELYLLSPNSSGEQPAYIWKYVEIKTGYMQIQKNFESGTTVNDASQYSLAGAVYYVYTDSACTTRAKDVDGNNISLTTNASGLSGKVEVVEGTYYIKEQTPSQGCEKDTTVRKVTVSESNTSSSPALVNSKEPQKTGFVYLKKQAQKTDTNYLSEAPNNYSLAGAVYYLYTDEDCTKRAKDVSGNNVTLTTKADGTTNVVEISLGTYYAKETTASKGFRFDSTNRRGTVTENNNTQAKAAVINSTEPPVYRPFEFKFRKVDVSGNHGYKQLLGTEYTISYYDVDMGYGNDAPSASTIEGQTAKRTWTYKTVQKTDQNGQPYAGFDTSVDDPEAGSSPFYTEDGKKVLPRGVFTIEETKAAPGMARDKNVYYCRVFQAQNGGDAATVFDINLSSYGDGASLTLNLKDDEQHPVIEIQKKDADTEKAAPQGADREFVKGSLAGAKFAVYYDDPAQSKPERVGTITTDEKGYGKLEKRTEGDERHIGDWLPLGTYLIEEETAPDGYLIDKLYYKDKDGEYKDGQHIVVARAQTGNTDSFAYTVESLEPSHHTYISKKEITTGDELPGATLQVLDSEGNIVEEWVSTDKPHDIVALHDETQGLKDGTYTLREITAPYGYDTAEDVEFTVSSKKIENTVEMKNAPIKIGTTATDVETGTHQGTFSKEEKIKDVVKYENLYAGRTYTFKGTLVDKKTGEALKDAEGNEITAKKKFTPEGEKGELVSGEVELEFTVDASEFTKEKSVVAFEDLDREGKELAIHADLKDEAQTIHYGGIVATTAVDSKSKGHNMLGEKDAVIIDTVKFENLSTEETYTLEGEIYDKTTGKLTGTRTSASFKPSSPNGTIKVTFKLDASQLGGHKLVVFEKLSLNGKEINKHEDPNDTDQTVNVPKIETLAVNPETNDHIANASETVTIKDTVSYVNLVPGKTYTVKGTLQYRDGVLKKLKTVMKDGKPLTAETTFTATAESGKAVVTFNFNGVDLAGKTTVVFEDLYDGEFVIATHADPDDADQSVHLPKIATKVGKKSGDYVIDTVEYKNLIPGKEYTVKGYFVEKANGKKVSGSDGEITFTPDKANGKIEVKLKPVKEGKTLVAFESIYLVTGDDESGDTEEVLVGEHKDLNDKAQTLPAAGGHSPNTGDSSLIFLYTSTLIAAAALCFVLVLRRRSMDRANNQ